MKSVRLLAALMLGALGLTACGGGGANSPTFTPVLESIEITNADGSRSVPAGRRLTLTAIGNFTNPPGSDAATEARAVQPDYTVSNPAVATIEGNQLVAVSVGNVTVTATKDGKSSAAVPFEVTPAVLEQIVVTPNDPTIPSGTTQTFSAQGIYSNSTSPRAIDETVTWSSSVVGVAIVSPATGATTTATTPRPATGAQPSPNVTIITASAMNSEGTTISDSSQLTVGPPITVTLSGITPLDPSVALGRTQTFQAAGQRSDDSLVTDVPDSELQWSSSNESVATINGAGLASTLTQGTTDITATLLAFPGQSQSTTLTVTPPVLTGIVITPDDPTIPMLGSVVLNAQGIYTDSATPRTIQTTVGWMSSNALIASVSPATGPSVTVQGLLMGNAAVTASSLNEENVTISSSVTVTVTSLLPLSLSTVAPTSSMETSSRSSTSVVPKSGAASTALPIGDTESYTAYGLYEDGLTYPLANSALEWTSDAPSIATVDGEGVITGIGNGTSGIKAKLKDDKAPDASPREASAPVQIAP
jgi:trimeric autotransporter adhesin